MKRDTDRNTLGSVYNNKMYIVTYRVRQAILYPLSHCLSMRQQSLKDPIKNIRYRGGGGKTNHLSIIARAKDVIGVSVGLYTYDVCVSVCVDNHVYHRRNQSRVN